MSGEQARSLEQERSLQDRKLGFIEGQEFERAVVIRYIRSIAAGQKKELAQGLLLRGFCEAIEEDLLLNRHHELCEHCRGPHLHD